MSVEITPEMLNDLEHKARGTCDPRWVLVNGNEVKPDHYRWSIAVFPDPDDAKFVAAANPAVVLTIIDEIKRLNERYDEQKLLATRMIEHAAEQKKEIERLRDRLDKLVCPNCGDLRKCCMCDVEQPEASQ
jgi:hypothetical protein